MDKFAFKALFVHVKLDALAVLEAPLEVSLERQKSPVVYLVEAGEKVLVVVVAFYSLIKLLQNERAFPLRWGELRSAATSSCASCC